MAGFPSSASAAAPAAPVDSDVSPVASSKSDSSADAAEIFLFPDGAAARASRVAAAARRVQDGADGAAEAHHFTSTSPPTPAQATKLAHGLSLAGAPLEAPRFHELCRQWRTGQCFTEAQDPDRTQKPWQAPGFARSSAAAQRAKTSAEYLRLPESGFACVVTGVLDEGHCASLIGSYNAKGFTPALVNRGNGGQQLAPWSRNGFRVIADDDEFTTYLFEVLRPYIPKKYWGAEVVGLNRRCRVLCYTPGQEFAAHCDGCYRDPSGTSSQITLQLYLHDVPEENGGATTFIFGDGSTLPCQPRRGSVLLFSQDLEHEGSLLTQGLKYTLRTEVMYEKPKRAREL